MKKWSDKIISEYGNRLRVRVCGLCIENNSILLVNHQIGDGNSGFWSPPGGGMIFGQSAEENLKREFEEETGLIVEVSEFLFTLEFLNPPLHAIELYFRVEKTGGDLIIGRDPEMPDNDQIIRNVRFMNLNDLKIIKKDDVHQVFHNCTDLDAVMNMRGYFIWNKNTLNSL